MRVDFGHDLVRKSLTFRDPAPEFWLLLTCKFLAHHQISLVQACANARFAFAATILSEVTPDVRAPLSFVVVRISGDD
jgi:hypothetical protein